MLEQAVLSLERAYEALAKDAKPVGAHLKLTQAAR